MTRPQALLAVSLAFVATAVYAVMWVGHSQDWGWLHSFDWSLLNAAHDIGIKNPAWVRFWDGVSLILGQSCCGRWVCWPRWSHWRSARYG